MTKEELSKLSDEELLVEAKKKKSTTILNAILIGFIIGVVIFSLVKNSIGLFTLIPLFLIYKLANKSKNYEDLNALLKARGLK